MEKSKRIKLFNDATNNEPKYFLTPSISCEDCGICIPSTSKAKNVRICEDCDNKESDSSESSEDDKQNPKLKRKKRFYKIKKTFNINNL